LGSTFFGLTSEHKLDIHKTLFMLAYYSKGAFTHSELYNMPIYLRTFYLNQLQEAKKEEANAVEKATKTSNSKKR